MSFHPGDCFDSNQSLQKTLSDKPCATAEAYAGATTHNDTASKHKETDLPQLVEHQKHPSKGHKATLCLILSSHAKSFEGLDDEQPSSPLSANG